MTLNPSYLHLFNECQRFPELALVFVSLWVSGGSLHLNPAFALSIERVSDSQAGFSVK
jgi:hypothetical protein